MTAPHDIVTQILEQRGFTTQAARDAFLHPRYDATHDPFLLPDMSVVVERLVLARKADEPITVYGDYDIDGLTATTVLLEALRAFGFSNVTSFIPNRFIEGYGLTVDAVEQIAQRGASLVITVDCGSLSHEPITRANELGMEVIVTDHHNVAEVQPPAVGVINPKRLLAEHPDHYQDFMRTSDDRSLYPFVDLPGVGVAFKLVQALQTRLDGLLPGQEKWLLDLVALGTVCDVVTLRDENRAHVYWGLKVLAQTRRPGLKALMAVARVEPEKVNARSLGFGLGPRLNAAGRLETAQIALDLLMATNPQSALALAQQLDDLNQARRAEQDAIYRSALKQAERYVDDDVLVVSSPEWNHGIIGIVAAKLLERFKKPSFVLQELGEESKGSARSYGDFSAADAIRASDDIITKGGGHKLAAGVTLPTAAIGAFRRRVNEFYRSQQLSDQAKLLLPREDSVTNFELMDERMIETITQLEPFGNGNPEPVLMVPSARVVHVRRMGSEGQHVKLQVHDGTAGFEVVAFNAPDYFFVEPETVVAIWYQPLLNEWKNRRSVEGRLLHLVTEPSKAEG